MKYLREFASADPEWESLKNRVNIGKSKLDSDWTDINDIITNELKDLPYVNSVSQYRKLIVFELLRSNRSGIQTSSIFLDSMSSTYPGDIKSIKDSFNNSSVVYYSWSYLVSHVDQIKFTANHSYNVIPDNLKETAESIRKRIVDLTGIKLHTRCELIDPEISRVVFMYEI